MFHIAVCEDIQRETEIILTLLDKFSITHPGVNMCVQSFCSGELLLDHLDGGKEYDLFLLDVLMPGITGIELAERLRVKNPEVPIVFMTSSADYALSAYNVSAVQYILKPVKENALFDTLDKILALRNAEKEKFFIFSTPERALKLSLSSIVYIEITGHVMKACLDNGKIMASKNIKVSFKTAIEPLLDDCRFLYSHKSYLINMEHVQELNGKTFIMTGGCVIPIPRYKLAEAKDKYFSFLSKRGIGCLGGDK